MLENSAVTLHFKLTPKTALDAPDVDFVHLPQSPATVERRFIFYLADKTLPVPVFVHVYYQNDGTHGVRREDLFKFAARAAKDFVNANPALTQVAVGAGLM